MSYNTRRSGGFGGSNQQQNVSSIGQRRPAITNNFVSGGQLNSQNKPGTQQVRPPHQAAQQSQNQNAGINFRNQQQSQPSQQSQQQQQQQPPQQQQQQTPQQQQPKQPTQVQVKMDMDTKSFANPPNPAAENTNGDPGDTSTDVVKKRPFWARGYKISKKEKVRRRNLRLGKILQPKNAVMILNELVKSTSYLVDELPNKFEGNQFKAIVMVESMEHVGYGRSKIQARNAAAETALKHLVKNNKLTEMKKDEEGNDEKMEVAEDDPQAPLPWQHVASFALFKLFGSWGEDPNIIKTSNKNQGQLLNSSGSSTSGDKPHENRPAKKMPENPETVNPLMLVNQMLPHAQFEEIGKSGNPPNVTFSFRCNVDGQSFIGTGPNKKAAKKLAAFGACNKVLGVNYPIDVYVPSY